MDFDLALQDALEADGERLFQLTGIDHGPYFDFDVYAPCPHCFESSGFAARSVPDTWSEPGWAEPDPKRPCPECSGTGQVPCDMVGGPDDREDEFEDSGYELALDEAIAGAQ